MNNDRNKYYNCQCNSATDSNNLEQRILNVNKWMNKVNTQNQDSIMPVALSLIHDSDFIEAIARTIVNNYEIVNALLNNRQFLKKMMDFIGATEDPTDPEFIKKIKEALINDRDFMAVLVVNIAQDSIFTSIVSQLLKDQLLEDADFDTKLATKLAASETLINGLVTSLTNSQMFMTKLEIKLADHDEFLSRLAAKLSNHAIITKIYVDDQDQAVLTAARSYTDQIAASKVEQEVVEEVAGQVETNTENLGDLSQLHTKTHDCLVNAINELETTRLDEEEKQKVQILLEKGIFGNAPSRMFNSAWSSEEILKGFQTPFDIVRDTDNKLLMHLETNKIEFHKVNEGKSYLFAPQNKSLRLEFNAQEGTLKYFNKNSTTMEEVVTKGDLPDIWLINPEHPKNPKYNHELYDAIDFGNADLENVKSISGLIEPVRLDHATNKAYVDSKYDQLSGEILTQEFAYQFYNSYQVDAGEFAFTDYNPEYWHYFYLYLQIGKHKIVGFIQVPSGLDPEYLLSNVAVDYSDITSIMMQFDPKTATIQARDWKKNPVKIDKIDVFRKRDVRFSN